MITYVIEEDSVKLWKIHPHKKGQKENRIKSGEIILEIKACTKIIPIYRDQVISYLKTTNKKLGLILNFGRRKLEIKRVVHNF